MANEDTKRYTLEELQALNNAGSYVPTCATAPAVEFDTAFWVEAEKVLGQQKRKESIHLRLDADTLAFFKSGGRGYLTRIAGVLKAYAQSQEKR